MSSARELLSRATAVLLDFDGPVTPLMPPPINRQVADAARHPLLAAGISLPDEIAQTFDHLAVLRYAWAHNRNHLRDVETACVAGEVHAARQSRPTPNAHDFLAACLTGGMPLAVVSNNSAEAVAAYIDRHGLRGAVHTVVGREPLRPDLMKPNGHSLRVASAVLGVHASTTVMVGDSLTDVTAAHSVSAKVIGYGKNPQRAVALREAGADVVIDGIGELAAALPRRPLDP